ncbi:MAG: four helix bundle protein, partial [Candidatus Paceibacterota bacterium]
MIHAPHHITPPRELPQVILKLKETYRVWLVFYRDFPKIERYGVGNKIEQAFLDTLELTFCLSYLSPENKIPILNKAITRLDVIRFFTQLSWENKLISNEKYADFS